MTKNSHPKKILIADDNKTIRLLLKKVIEKLDMEAIEAGDGKEAIELFHSENPDAILMDIHMPEVDGYSACREIKKSEKGAFTPIMMVTVVDDIDSINHSFEAGATDFSTKPINAAIISHRIKYMLRNNNNLLELEKHRNMLLKTQNELIELNRELEQRVLERTAKLQEANIALSSTIDELKMTQKELVESKKMAALAQLIAGLAHEINTPLGVSIAASSSIEANIDAIDKLSSESPLSPKLMQKLHTLQQSIKMLLTNLNRAGELVKSFKRVSVDNITSRKEAIDIGQYLREVVTSLSPEIKTRKVDVEINSDEIVRELVPGALYQVMTILIMNSLKHAFENIENEEKKITLDVKEKNGKVKIEYRDNGIGIDAKHLEKIFDPFYTVEQKAGSMGLGLHIAYNIVTQSLKGSITCESTPGKGTKFTVTF